jgi:hypothetical protein
MTARQLLSIAVGLAFVAFIVFAFRQGLKVRPDTNRKNEDWPRITQGGPGG